MASKTVKEPLPETAEQQQEGEKSLIEKLMAEIEKLRDEVEAAKAVVRNGVTGAVESAKDALDLSSGGTTGGEWDEKLTIRLPKAQRDEEKSLHVSVNGRDFLIPKGKEVEVPKPVYERVMLMQQAMDDELDFRESIPKDAAPEQK